MKPVATRSPAALRSWVTSIAWLPGVALGLLSAPALSAELVQPLVCSAATAAQLPGICELQPLGNGHNDVKVNLTAASAAVAIGGYKVVTENYNGNYLTPVIEAMPGDTVSAHLVNALSALTHAGMPHGASTSNPTNLHYFHGGIVTPNNSRPKQAEMGDGDNIYVHLNSGVGTDGKPNSFDFHVPIPEQLDARVLESSGLVPYPQGLNWYHSHMHGISSNQVMGGMSGLLSVGEAKANVKALCLKDPNDESKCPDLDDDTRDLRNRTKAQYALLRDIPLKITKRPDQAAGDMAEWDMDPSARDFSPTMPPCGVWKADNSGPDVDESLRLGFCQRSQNTALLFTVNGQRFPTMTVEGDQNLLIRLGNLSANVPYWLELRNEADGTVLPLTILSLDGVVPAVPVSPGKATKPVKAVDYDDVLLMPATRAEIYVRNDVKSHSDQQTYILQAKKHATESDEWPAIRLAQIVLKPNAAANKVVVALNASVATASAQAGGAAVMLNELQHKTHQLPVGCMRDLNPGEFRRVMFLDNFMQLPNVDWTIQTEIVRPMGTALQDQADHAADPTSTIANENGGGRPFDDYEQNGLVNWTDKKHVCIDINHAGSHQQLWVLVNGTATLHNFHIHQMKFRLATATELKQKYFIKPPELSHDCKKVGGVCTTPDYNFYDDEQVASDQDPGATRRWHDTIPMPPGAAVFLVMSFDADQQIGRFVFHCHILKHEDRGLMAPIEVVRTSDGTGTEANLK